MYILLPTSQSHSPPATPQLIKSGYNLPLARPDKEWARHCSMCTSWIAVWWEAAVGCVNEIKMEGGQGDQYTLHDTLTPISAHMRTALQLGVFL